MTKKEIDNDLAKLNHRLDGIVYTKDVLELTKSYIHESKDVSCLKEICNENENYYFIYMMVSLKPLNLNERIAFLKKHLIYLNSWWSVDYLLKFFKKADFETLHNFSLYLSQTAFRENTKKGLFMCCFLEL